MGWRGEGVEGNEGKDFFFFAASTTKPVLRGEL